MSTQPTDEELYKQWCDAVETHVTTRDFVCAFARAVLEKWGTPAPVGAEPIGYLYCGGSYGDELADWEIVADQHQCDKLNEHHGSLGKEAKLPIYTTPQPTQAQAGAVPLTDEQCDAIYEALDSFGHEVDHYEFGLPYRASDGETLAKTEAREVIRQAAHGIKGGQHGTDRAARAPADSVLEDAAFEAVRKKLCALPRYSFVLDDDGLVRRVQDRSGNWIEFDDAHELFDPVAVDASRKQGEK